MNRSRIVRSTAPIKRTPIKCKRNKPPLRAGGVPQNPKYLEFIRSLPCILFGDPRHECSGRVEAAHVGWGAGMKQKAPDETAVPMCVRLHRTGVNAHHKGTRTFWGKWKLDREQLIASYQAKYESSK